MPRQLILILTQTQRKEKLLRFGSPIVTSSNPRHIQQAVSGKHHSNLLLPISH
jgi:hypothetical protein